MVPSNETQLLEGVMAVMSEYNLKSVSDDEGVTIINRYCKKGFCLRQDHAGNVQERCQHFDRGATGVKTCSKRD